MKNLLYYDLETEFVEDQIEAGGDGTHVKTIVDGVAWCKDTKNAFYNTKEDRKHEKYKTMHLTFEILSNGYISWRAKSGSLTRTIQYSKDGGNSWTTITSTTGGTNISVVAGDTVMFRGNNTSYATDSDNSYNGFSGSTAQFKAKGNIMSLINSTNFVSLTTLTGTYAFSSMFRDCTTLTDISNLLLPALTLTNCCYRGMFMKCTSLSGDIPELPAKTVPYWGYQAMYRESSVSKVSSNCLSCTKIGASSLRDMFYCCTQLTSAPIKLNLTTMSGACCMGMFNGCTNLVTGPKELNSTSLASECYTGMFSGCTSLTTAPELPATTLVNACYDSMFIGCTNLNYIKCLATNISASDSHRNWVSGVASSGTFVKAASMSSWPSGVNGIPTNWTVQDAS